MKRGIGTQHFWAESHHQASPSTCGLLAQVQIFKIQMLPHNWGSTADSFPSAGGVVYSNVDEFHS